MFLQPTQELTTDSPFCFLRRPVAPGAIGGGGAQNGRESRLHVYMASSALYLASEWESPLLVLQGSIRLRLLWARPVVSDQCTIDCGG